MSAAGTSAEAMQKQNRTEHKMESIAVPGMLFGFFIINPPFIVIFLPFLFREKLAAPLFDVCRLRFA